MELIGKKKFLIITYKLEKARITTLIIWLGDSINPPPQKKNDGTIMKSFQRDRNNSLGVFRQCIAAQYICGSWGCEYRQTHETT
jgi:hypothetical protein